MSSKGTAVYDNTAGDGTRKLQNAVVCVPARYGECTVDITGGTFTAEGNSKVIDTTYGEQEGSNTKNITVTGGN
ncbi:hypothetical protein V4Y02_24125, partial [Escherichia coli]